ncbi:glutathione S-transferase C-terminal-like protein [Trametes versicolor FP-101664 SS1]|uniref:glutathione S-transferase C-terminal-like protein n=1 Tax=Trametes versicolor (strain FP-101664) TaxID=717944 RepID=UPI00046212AF|nr:glutathione S-transferase C-terminal-like protein [Trametes versicolor FP-101664 SS1]EIW59525.1 glutathione S-transferase C-terminal-like protein [Trametes versicolor FP-101664 SS1]
MSQQHHFTLYTHKTAPNGWKVAIVLEELGLDYHSIYIDFTKDEHRAPEHTQFNPNGRIPTLVDHKNNDFAVWESNAIITYLVDKYDTDGKISATSFEEKTQQLQWLFFQASGQGPYFGQAVWFIRSHPEKVQSAVERYQKEILRVLGVLESVLSKQEWLVGGRFTVTDLSFVVWNKLVLDGTATQGYYSAAQFEKDFPAVYKWHQLMMDRPTVKKIYALRESLKSA